MVLGATDISPKQVGPDNRFWMYQMVVEKVYRIFSYDQCREDEKFKEGPTTSTYGILDTTRLDFNSLVVQLVPT